MAAGARQLGAEIYRRNRVMDIKLLPNGEWRVFTEKGTIDCEHVVNSAGSYCDVVAHGQATTCRSPTCCTTMSSPSP